MTTYAATRPRGIVRLLNGVDDFMNWLLFGYETWVIAVLKAVPLFLFMYFLLFYIPNYVYYGLTLYIPFLKFGKDVGFLVANLVGGGNFTALIVLALWTQASRGRSGFFWSLVRYLDLGQYLLTVLVLVPFMAFNLAGGSLIPFQVITPGECGDAGMLCEIGRYRAILFGMVTAGIGAVTFVYLWFEYRRIARREALAATEAAAALTTGG